MSCVYFIMSAPRHDKIGRQGGSGPRPRIAPAIKDKINALRLFYHISAVNQSFLAAIFSLLGRHNPANSFGKGRALFHRVKRADTQARRSAFDCSIFLCASGAQCSPPRRAKPAELSLAVVSSDDKPSILKLNTAELVPYCGAGV